MQEDESSAAEELGMLDLNPDSERLLLFQLPSLLPVSAPSQNPGGSNTPVKPLTQHEACSLHQLPAGKVSHSSHNSTLQYMLQCMVLNAALQLHWMLQCRYTLLTGTLFKDPRPVTPIGAES